MDYHQTAEAQEYVQDLMEKASASADQMEEEEEEEEQYWAWGGWWSFQSKTDRFADGGFTMSHPLPLRINYSYTLESAWGLTTDERTTAIRTERVYSISGRCV